MFWEWTWMQAFIYNGLPYETFTGFTFDELHTLTWVKKAKRERKKSDQFDLSLLKVGGKWEKLKASIYRPTHNSAMSSTSRQQKIGILHISDVRCSPNSINITEFVAMMSQTLQCFCEMNGCPTIKSSSLRSCHTCNLLRLGTRLNHHEY